VFFTLKRNSAVIELRRRIKIAEPLKIISSISSDSSADAFSKYATTVEHMEIPLLQGLSHFMQNNRYFSTYLTLKRKK
jgi:hypothetical protein